MVLLCYVVVSERSCSEGLEIDLGTDLIVGVIYLGNHHLQKLTAPL
jgi:hypothetical protein